MTYNTQDENGNWGAATLYVCGKCGRTADDRHVRDWLVAKRVDTAEARVEGWMVIRCPEHITAYARRIAGLPQKRTRATAGEVTVRNYRMSRRFGWAYSFHPTGRTPYEIETPARPMDTGTLRQLAQVIEDDRTWQVHSRSASSATAWFYDGRRITHTWCWTNLTPMVTDNGEWVENVTYGYGWIDGFHPERVADTGDKDIRIKLA